MQKNYLASSIKSFTFKNGGIILNCSFKSEDLQKIERNGWIKLKIAERKKPSDKGATHYAYEDDWQPQAGQSTHPQYAPKETVGGKVYVNPPEQKNTIPPTSEVKSDDEEINVEDIPF